LFRISGTFIANPSRSSEHRPARFGVNEDLHHLQSSFGLPPQRLASRVLHLEPIRRAARTIGRFFSFRHDAFEPHLTGRAKTVPSPSICSLNRMPGRALAEIDASVALRTGRTGSGSAQASVAERPVALPPVIQRERHHDNRQRMRRLRARLRATCWFGERQHPQDQLLDMAREWMAANDAGTAKAIGGWHSHKESPDQVGASSEKSPSRGESGPHSGGGPGKVKVAWFRRFRHQVLW
jgi:hypothetical protein